MLKLRSQRTDEGDLSGMTTLEFFDLLKRRNVQIEARDGKLKISAPAGTIDGVLKAELKERKQALLETLGKVKPTELAPLTAEELRGRIPLTAAQEGMWLIDHFNPGDVAYNIPEAFRFEEWIEPETLQAAVDGLVERHSVLRSSFHEEEGELSQMIDASAAVRVGFIDFSSFGEEEGERRCREAIRREGRRAFDLKRAPLLRCHLFRLPGNGHVLFLNIHHIISDRRSLYVVREELLALSRADGRSDAALPPLHLQFADYAAWTARQVQSEVMKRQIEYWKTKLAGLAGYLELPHSRPWPEKRTGIGAAKPVRIYKEERAALNRIGKEEGASPFMSFLAVFAIAIARWCCDDKAADFCIGSPISQRAHPATERMIGLFVNMLVFRCRIAPGMSLRDVLRQVRGTALEAYENSDVPFRRLVREINHERGSPRSPLFQVMFSYETYQAPLANEFQMDADPGTARYDLALHVSETAGGGLTGSVEYCTDLFEDADIDMFVAESEACIAEMLRDPEQDVFRPQAFVKQAKAEVARTTADPSGELEATSDNGVLRKIVNLLPLKKRGGAK